MDGKSANCYRNVLIGNPQTVTLGVMKMKTNRRSENRYMTRAKELANTQYGVVAGWQLNGASDPDSGVIRPRNSQLIQVRTGVYTLGHTALSRRGILMAGVLAAGPDGLLSHQSAAELWEFGRPSGVIHVIGKSSRLRRHGAVPGVPPLRIHRTNFLHIEDRTTLSGIPVSSVPRTFSDIAGTERPSDLLVQFNKATRDGKMNIKALRRLLGRTTGKAGQARLEAILNRYHPLHRLTKSELEDLFVELCRAAGLPSPRVNEWVLGMKVDIFWPEFGLIVELDSRAFHDDDRGHEVDRERTARLELAGYRVLRLTWAMVTEDRDETIRKVIRYMRMAAATSTASGEFSSIAL